MLDKKKGGQVGRAERWGGTSKPPLETNPTPHYRQEKNKPHSETKTLITTQLHTDTLLLHPPHPPHQPGTRCLPHMREASAHLPHFTLSGLCL